MRAAVILSAMVATAHADPCVSRSPWLGVQDGAVVLCNTASCVKATPDGLGASAPRSKRATAGKLVTTTAVIRGRSACNGAACTPLGPHLDAAIGRKHVAVTDDRKLVLIDRTAWSVAADRPIVFAKPAEYAAESSTVPAVVGVEVVRDFIVVTWKGCAGPCDWSVVVDAAGKNVGARFPAGRIYQLDAHRVAVLAANAEPGRLTLLDEVTGALLDSAPLGGDGDAQLVRAPDGTLAAWSFETLTWFELVGPTLKQLATVKPRACP